MAQPTKADWLAHAAERSADTARLAVLTNSVERILDHARKGKVTSDEFCFLVRDIVRDVPHPMS